jgi:hypothetical protein
VAHPIETLGNIKNLGLGILEKTGIIGTILPSAGGDLFQVKEVFEVVLVGMPLVNSKLPHMILAFRKPHLQRTYVIGTQSWQMRGRREGGLYGPYRLDITRLT